MDKDLLESKIEIIKENKESSILALNSNIDGIYNMIDKYFDINMSEDGKIKRTLKPELDKDEKVEKLILECEKDAIECEKVKNKLKQDNFNLSMEEVARVGLSFVFCGICIEKQKNQLIAAEDEIKAIVKNLLEDMKGKDISNTENTEK